MVSKKCRARTEELKKFNPSTSLSTGRLSAGTGFGLWFFVFSFQFLFIFGLCGCSSVMSPYVMSKRQELPYDADISDSYYKIELKKSGALDVLPMIHKPEYELLSQSRSVVASFGQEEDGYKSWFNMVAFDEVRLTAKRKYFFLVDEKVKRLPGKRRGFLMEPKPGLMFDSQMVLEKIVFDKPLTSEDAGQISYLRQILRNLRKDISELGQGVDGDALGSDNKMLTISGMLINQIFETVLYTLDSSPGLAEKLGGRHGVEFDHISFGKGTIKMVVEDGVAAVRIRVGVFVGVFDEPDRRGTIEEESFDLEDYQ